MKRPLAYISFAALLTVANAGAVQAQPDPKLEPAYGSAVLKAGFTPDPHKQDLVAGGSIKTKLGGVEAHVAKKPDYRLEYTAGKYQLGFYVKSKAKTTLLIHLPDGTWAANGASPDPLIVIGNPASGRYQIYVGTIGPDPEGATLHITETIAAPAAKHPQPPRDQQGGTPEEQDLFHGVMERLLQTPEVRKQIPAGITWPPFCRVIPKSEKDLNAFAGQSIYTDGTVRSEVTITEGLLRKANGDPNHVACVMGHELVHLLRKHLAYGQKDVLRLAITREQELEADLEGLKIAVAAGYLDDGGPKFLKTFLDAFGSVPHLANLKVTHPANLDRLQILDRQRAHIWRAMAAYSNGNFLLASEQYRSAESCFEAVVKAYPDSQEAWANLGYARLMQYCDALDEKDLRKLGIGQIAAGCFYFRPEGFVPTRGTDAKLWQRAVDALNKARAADPDARLTLVRANLAIAYLVHPDGKADAQKALEYFAEIENSKDRGVDELSMAALLVNKSVAHQAAGDAAKAKDLLAQADKLLAKQFEKKQPVSGILSQVDRAYLYNHSLVLQSSTKADERQLAFKNFRSLLSASGLSSMWWSLTHERYEKLGKELNLAVEPREKLVKQGAAGLPRPVIDVTIAPGKTITLADKTADVLTLFGVAGKTGIPVFKNARVYRYNGVAPGIDLIGGDRVATIFLTSSQAPPVFVQMSGLGSPKKELRVGMSMSEYKNAIQGLQYATAPWTIDDPSLRYVAFPALGLALRFADDRVYEIAILQVPEKSAY